jgi:hypothetical protein
MSSSDDREARIQAILDQLRPAADDALRKMAEALADRPDHELFGPVEHELRDAAHGLARAAHQAAADGRKKGATRAPASCAPTVGTTPASTPTGPGPS